MTSSELTSSERTSEREAISFGLEDIDEVLAAMAGEQAVDRPREGELITCRLGLDGEPPETLTLLGARFGVSRDRARQLYTRAVGNMVRQAQNTGVHDLGVFTERYPVGWSDERLVRTLLAETYATDSDIAAQDRAYLKLRLAGHDLQESKRLAGFVFQRIAGWQQKGRWHLLPPQQADEVPAGVWNPWLHRVEWGDGTPDELPAAPARTLDLGDDGRGFMYSEKLGRETTFDTGLQARLFRLLDGSERVETFQEYPVEIAYEIDGGERLHYPTAAVRFTDGRVVLIDVIPLGHTAFHVNRVKSTAGRAYAHAHGWGWLVWTGTDWGVADLAQHSVAARHENILRNRLAKGPVDWTELRRYREDTGIQLLDLAAMVLRHQWRWDRGPFRLSR
ncbi:hypothetical protein [Nocardia sp. NBC_01327]|uniref:hypothetical protein n=1 Tax=Nocardia sp. NBC_01327 TaxID=2903593 RepID=UPI002E0D7AB1|nr:hypothetical protein OG326_15515 [Nocardia sp. NBC_01327]